MCNRDFPTHTQGKNGLEHCVERLAEVAEVLVAILLLAASATASGRMAVLGSIKSPTGDQGHFVPLDVDVFATLAIILEEVHGYDGLGRAAADRQLLPKSA